MPMPPEAKTALEAMKNIGFPRKEAGPVLKKLLKVCGNNWEYIEENSYQVLIESILEEQELRAVGAQKQDAVVGDDLEHSRKKLRKLDETNPSTSVLGSDGLGEASMVKPKEEPDIFPEWNITERRLEPVSPISTQADNRSKAKDPSLPQPSPSSRKTEHDLSPMNRRVTRASACAHKISDAQENGEGSSLFIHHKDTSIEPSVEMQENTMAASPTKSKDREANDDQSEFAVPIAIIYPPHHPTSTGNGGGKRLPPPQAIAALEAMKNVGFPRKEAEPMLKKLLKACSNNWEYIEENSYQILIESILEEQELKAVGAQKQDAVVGEDLERSRKRSRKFDETAPSTSILGSDGLGEVSMIKPKEEPDIFPELNFRERGPEPVSPISTQADNRSKAKDPASPQPSSSSRKSEHDLSPVNRRVTRAFTLAHKISDAQENGEGSSHFTHHKETNREPGVEMQENTTATSPTKSKDREADDGQSEFAAPIVMICPPHLPTSTGNGGLRRPLPPQAIAALEAMKNIGFPKKEAQHVLKKLLKVYDDNWEYIEENSYQVLIESILEEQELKAVGSQKQDAAVNDDPEHSRKRLRKLGETNPSPSLNGSDCFGETSMIKQKVGISPEANLMERRPEPTSPISTQAQNNCKAKEPVLPQPSPTSKKTDHDLSPMIRRVTRASARAHIVSAAQENNEGSSLLICSKETNIDPGVEMQVNRSKDREADDDLSEFVVPITVICPPHHPIPAENEAHQSQRSQDDSSIMEMFKANADESSATPKAVRSIIANPKPPHDPNDITKGEERARISLVNEVSNEKYPSSFNYIPRNLVHQNANVNISLSRIGEQNCCSRCFGDCVSASIPCPCAQATGGEFAYTLDGLLKEAFLDECISMDHEPQKHHFVFCKDCLIERCKNGAMPGKCKGHLARKFIKECWRKCGCNMQCKNRVTQQGIMFNLQVFFTPEGKGWGLRTMDELPKGAFVCEYVGEILTTMELYHRTIQSTGCVNHTYPVLLDAEWGSKEVLKDKEALCLDATFYGNVARFINHRCFDANLIGIPVEVETPDHHYYHFAFFTTRKIEQCEELTWDYGIDFDGVGHPLKAINFKCRCQSRFCRDMKRSKSKSKALVLG